MMPCRMRLLGHCGSSLLLAVWVCLVDCIAAPGEIPVPVMLRNLAWASLPGSSPTPAENEEEKDEESKLSGFRNNLRWLSWRMLWPRPAAAVIPSASDREHLLGHLLGQKVRILAQNASPIDCRHNGLGAPYLC